jgi:hypothetical protein
MTYFSFYQHSGDAKNLYFAQYSDVCEDSPVIVSWTTMKNNMPMKNRLKPLKANFNAFAIEFFLPIADYIVNR